MFGKKKDGTEQYAPENAKVRSSIYGLAALYLAYLFYKVAKPYLTGDPYGPSTKVFLLAVVVLGGGAAGLGILAWKMAHMPAPPVEEPPPAEETPLELEEPQPETDEETGEAETVEETEEDGDAP